MGINGRFNLTECLFIQYTRCACEGMVEYMYVCMHNLMYACILSMRARAGVCVCVCTLDHITFKLRNPRHFSVFTDSSHMHTRKITDT